MKATSVYEHLRRLQRYTVKNFRSLISRRRLNYGHRFITEELGAIRADGMEADDLVAIWAYEQMDMGYDPVIAGIDKDSITNTRLALQLCQER